jgi:hypothetical protein
VGVVIDCLKSQDPDAGGAGEQGNRGGVEGTGGIKATADGVTAKMMLARVGGQRRGRDGLALGVEHAEATPRSGSLRSITTGCLFRIQVAF